MHADSLVELVGAEVGPRTGLGLYGRYIDGRRLEDPHAGRLRCEVLPISDDPALSLLRAGLAVEEPLVPAGPADPVSRSPSATTVGAAVVLLVLSGLVLAAALTDPPAASREVASTDAVLAAIRAAFR